MRLGDNPHITQVTLSAKKISHDLLSNIPLREVPLKIVPASALDEDTTLALAVLQAHHPRSVEIGFEQSPFLRLIAKIYADHGKKLSEYGEDIDANLPSLCKFFMRRDLGGDTIINDDIRNFTHLSSLPAITEALRDNKPIKFLGINASTNWTKLLEALAENYSLETVTCSDLILSSEDAHLLFSSVHNSKAKRIDFSKLVIQRGSPETVDAYIKAITNKSLVSLNIQDLSITLSAQKLTQLYEGLAQNPNLKSLIIDYLLNI